MASRARKPAHASISSSVACSRRDVRTHAAPCPERRGRRSAGVPCERREKRLRRLRARRRSRTQRGTNRLDGDGVAIEHERTERSANADDAGSRSTRHIEMGIVGRWGDSGFGIDDLTSGHFKGWAKPGPVPPGASSPPAVPPEETLDAISGHFRIFQLRRGHRFSTDDVLTAWYGTTWAPSPSSVLDLGSGIGSVATIAAWRLQGARLVTIEVQGESVWLARKSADYNGLAGRMDIREGDFRDVAVLGADERFDLALGSPPHFPPGSGVEGDHPQKIACRFEMRGDIQDYARAAAGHLTAGGVFACIFRRAARSRGGGCRER